VREGERTGNLLKTKGSGPERGTGEHWGAAGRGKRKEETRESSGPKDVGHKEKKGGVQCLGRKIKLVPANSTSPRV